MQQSSWHAQERLQAEVERLTAERDRLAAELAGVREVVASGATPDRVLEEQVERLRR